MLVHYPSRSQTKDHPAIKSLQEENNDDNGGHKKDDQLSIKILLPITRDNALNNKYQIYVSSSRQFSGHDQPFLYALKW